MNLNSWGMYPIIKNKSFALKDKNDLKNKLNAKEEVIPFGNGRSYGDSALNESIIYCKPHNYFLNFDKENGVLHVQAGVLLSEILEICIPKGWFLKVTPGTKLITVGGAIASDVHGKNHHVEGCFSECVEEFSLMLPSGNVVTCKKGGSFFLLYVVAWG